MPLLNSGELRAILERDLPGALAQPFKPQRTNGTSAAGSHQQKVQEDAAATMGATDNAPITPEAAADRQAEPIEEEGTQLPDLIDDDAVINAASVPDVLLFMRDQLGYDYLSHITAVDYIAYGMIEVIYHLFQSSGGPGQIVRVRVPRDNAEIPSIATLWPAANLQEREAYDLFGVRFPGHPYHKRIYMWDEFEGHPMRKDFEKIGDAYYHFKWKGEDEE